MRTCFTFFLFFLTAPRSVEVARRALGRAGVVMSDICIILSCFGLVTSYLLVVGDALVDPIATVSSMAAEDIRIVLLCTATAVLVPLGCMRYLNHLRYGRSVMGLLLFFFSH